MSSLHIRMAEGAWRALLKHHLQSGLQKERLSYMFGHTASGRDGKKVLLFNQAPILPADDCYIGQSQGHVAIDPAVQASIMAQFAASGCTVLMNCHDHWFSQGGTSFSGIDTKDDLALDKYLRGVMEPMLREPQYGPARQVTSLSVVLDQRGLDARVANRRGGFRQVESLDVVGARAERFQCNGAVRSHRIVDAQGLRQEDFIPPDQAALIADLTFGLIGCGGLGSVLGESLVRWGARRIIFFDDDRLEAHNLNRWQGGGPADVGRPKAELLAQRLRPMAPSETLYVVPVHHSILDPLAAPFLKTCDVIVGGVDNHLARSFLNRFALQYLTPYFDAGVNIRTKPEVDFESRVFTVIPGTTACAECTAYKLLDQAAIRDAFLDDVTREEQRRAGYVVDRPEVTAAASAYALNQRAVSTLMFELMNWVGSFRPLATCVSEIWREGRFQRSDRGNHAEHSDPNCAACCTLGTGDAIELPRPPPPGQSARILTEACAAFDRAAQQP